MIDGCKTRFPHNCYTKINDVRGLTINNQYVILFFKIGMGDPQIVYLLYQIQQRLEKPTGVRNPGRTNRGATDEFKHKVASVDKTITNRDALESR